MPTGARPAVPARASTRRHRAAWLAAGALLAAVFLYFSLRGIDWGQVVRTIEHAAPRGLVLAVTIATAALFVRAYRWRVLLNAEGRVSIASAFWATAAGYFANNFLPARAGELVRTLMISSRDRLDKGYVLATALSERVADAVILVSVSAGLLVLLPSQPGWLAGAVRPFAVLGGIGALGIAILPLLEPLARAAIEHAPLPRQAGQRIVAVMQDALRGMRVFHNPARLCGFFGLTLAVWSLDAAGAVIVARALGMTMPPSAALVLIAALGVGSALPSTPGYVGIYQFVAVTVLAPFGFSRTNAIAFILVAQALSYAACAFWGGLGLVQYRRARPAIQP